MISWTPLTGTLVLLVICIAVPLCVYFSIWLGTMAFYRSRFHAKRKEVFPTSNRINNRMDRCS